MPATYITDTELKTYFSAHLGFNSNTTLETRFDALATVANRAAYNTIVGKLLERGFTLAQIDTWDRRKEFNYDLACCHLLRTALKGEASDLWQQKFCRTEELETVPVVIDGVLILVSSGNIGYGEMERTDDVFTRDTEW